MRFSLQISGVFRRGVRGERVRRRFDAICPSESRIGVVFGAEVLLFAILLRIYRGWFGRWGSHCLDLVSCEGEGRFTGLVCLRS